MSSTPAPDAQFPERFVPEEMRGLIEVEHLARYRWASGSAAGRRVLDAGCGVGYGSLILHEAGAASVTGVDIAQEAVDAAVRRAGHGAEFILGDVERLELADDSFELAVCFETIEHVRDQDAALNELRRVLVDDGLLFISSPNRDVYQEGNPHHTREYTPEELRAALAERFEHVRLFRQQAWLASMIGTDETLEQSDPSTALGVELRKVAAVPPGGEMFVLAIASDAALPAPEELAMMTDLSELATWRERARSAEEHVARAHDAGLESATAYAALREAYNNALAALEHSQGESAGRQQQVDRLTSLLAEREDALRAATAALQKRREDA